MAKSTAGGAKGKTGKGTGMPDAKDSTVKAGSKSVPKGGAKKTSKGK